MSETRIQEYKEAGLNDFIVATQEYAGELTIEVKAANIREVIKTLKTMFGYNYLSDITGVDHFTDDQRFGVAYNLMALEEKKRIRITARIESEEKPVIDSINDIHTAATWYEREVYDMLGIAFEGHPDLRRIFMPEDFEYFPLRKEFPLIGIPGSIQLPEKDPPKEYK